VPCTSSSWSRPGRRLPGTGWTGSAPLVVGGQQFTSSTYTLTGATGSPWSAPSTCHTGARARSSSVRFRAAGLNSASSCNDRRGGDPNLNPGRPAVTWSGDGAYTVTTATPSHVVTHGVTTLGSTVLQVVWKGIESAGDSRWVSSQGAYWDSYREGHFQQCILSKGCTTNDWYPFIHEYLYANGGDVIRSLE